DVHRAKLQTFLRRRHGQESASDPEEGPDWLRPSPGAPRPGAPRQGPARASTWIEVTDPAQLSPGVRLNHPKYGLGRVKRSHGGQLQVAFDQGGERWIRPGGVELHLVQDDADPGEG